MHLEDTHPAFYEPPNEIKLNACSYLHNYHYEPDDIIYAPKFSEALKNCPTYCADHFEDLTSFLKSHVEAGDGMGILKRVEENQCRPSKKLMQHVGNVIRGNHFGIDLLDAVQNKLQTNEMKYPVEKSRGSSKKYTDLSSKS